MRDVRVLSRLVAGVIIAAATACGGAQVQPDGQRRPLLECPAYQVANGDTITVTSAGGEFDLQFGNRIVFEPGSVTTDAQYRITPGPTQNGVKTASIDIESLGAAPDTFLVPVQIRLNYAACGNVNPTGMVKIDVGVQTDVPSLEHPPWMYGWTMTFTGFAVAM